MVLQTRVPHLSRRSRPNWRNSVRKAGAPRLARASYGIADSKAFLSKMYNFLLLADNQWDDNSMMHSCQTISVLVETLGCSRNNLDLKFAALDQSQKAYDSLACSTTTSSCLSFDEVYQAGSRVQVLHL